MRRGASSAKGEGHEDWKASQRARRRAGIAGAAALALGTGGTAFAQAPVNPLGNPQEVLNTALTKKEGCDYPGALVPVVALLSYDAVYGCGYYEYDPAHPNYPRGG